MLSFPMHSCVASCSSRLVLWRLVAVFAACVREVGSKQFVSERDWCVVSELFCCHRDIVGMVRRIKESVVLWLMTTKRRIGYIHAEMLSFIDVALGGRAC